MRIRESRTGVLRAVGVAAAIAIGAAGARAETLERVLAVVGGTQVVTLTDVTAARAFGLVIIPANAPDPIRAALTQLVDRELMLAEVDRYAPPEPSVEAVNDSLRVVRARFDGDAAYQAALARSGIDESHLRDTLRQNLRITEYLNQRFVVPPPDGVAPGRASAQGALIDEWLAGLRRRAAIVDLYLTNR